MPMGQLDMRVCCSKWTLCLSSICAPKRVPMGQRHLYTCCQKWTVGLSHLCTSKRMSVEQRHLYICCQKWTFGLSQVCSPKRVPWVELTCMAAAKNGHLECFMYACNNGCPSDWRFDEVIDTLAGKNTPDNQLCNICYSNYIKIQILPCNHTVCCGSCFKTINKDSQNCPMCRAEIIDYKHNNLELLKPGIINRQL